MGNRTNGKQTLRVHTHTRTHAHTHTWYSSTGQPSYSGGAPPPPPPLPLLALALDVAEVNHTTQSVKAEVCRTHYAHESRLDHVRISEEVRLKITGKLDQGVTYDKILDDIRNSVSDNFKRIQLTQRMRCQEENCEFSCRYVRQLRSYLSKEHFIKIDSEPKNFSSEEGLSLHTSGCKPG